MTNPLVPVSSVCPFEDRFRTVKVTSGLRTIMGGLLADPVSVTAGGAGGGSSAPMTAAGDRQTVTPASTDRSGARIHFIASTARLIPG